MSSKYFILSLIIASLIGFPIISNQTYTETIDQSSSCQLKVLIQVPFLGDKKASDKDQEIEG